MPNSDALDQEVGQVVATLKDGTEYRQVLLDPAEGQTHVTPDGRTWVAMHEGVINGAVIRSPFTIHWRPPMTGSLQTDPEALDKLARHKAFLEAHGITNLAALGTLTLSGAVVPQPGLVRAPFLAPDARNAGNFTTAEVNVRSARRIVAPTAPGQAHTISLFSGKANAVIGEPLVDSKDATLKLTSAAAAASAVSLPINTAYLVGGDLIDFPDDTTIVLQANVRYLVIIANAIHVGARVAITYDEFPVVDPPAIPAKPPAPSSRPATPSSFSDGSPGFAGHAGTQPLQIGAPPNAPEVEVWTNDINSLPTVYLKGQQGYTGVKGGNGGNGGPGGNGSESRPGRFFCKAGPGSGGKGGPGGPGGTGGSGGNGGSGGSWALYATSDTILKVVSDGFSVEVGGGEGGIGGPRGSGGSGGAGGNHGVIHGTCANNDWSDRHDGPGGDSGGPGNTGPNGAAGTTLGSNPIKFVPIQATDFNQLTDPAITQVYPSTVNVGDVITISGLRFTPTDKITVGGVPTPMLHFFTDTLIQCIVPNTAGGLSNVQVSRSDNSGPSNLGTLFIAPTVHSTIPASPPNRLRPGDTYSIVGAGFNSSTVVRVNNTDIAQATFIDSQRIDFVMKRPDSVPFDPANAGGEPALLSVAVSGGILASNALNIVIATYQMLVIGDSVAWGEGLQEQDKFYTLVAQHVQNSNPGISFYQAVKAHDNAILGWNANGSGPEFPGDIPELYPSIKRQALTLASLPNAGTVDLILLTATANDVGPNFVLDPITTHDQIQQRVDQYCLTDMTFFLEWLAGAFPVAKIIVAGYYIIFSMDSDPTYLVDLVGVIFALAENQGLVPDLLAIAKGISPAGKPAIAGNSTFFAAQTNAALATAVANANGAIGASRIFFADPQFGPQNAALASDPWVFGVGRSIFNILQPTDSPAAANLRISECSAVYPRPVADLADRTVCDLASAGHPNETGAQRYAAAINAFLP